MSNKFQRVLIKISGEALAGSKHTGFDFNLVSSVCEEIQRAQQLGAQIGIVIGAGNFWRGVKDGAGKVGRVNADRMGMLGTAMNCLAVSDVFSQLGAKNKVMTAMDIQGVGERFDAKKAIEYLEEDNIVLFGCGTGLPYFSTDTAAVMRALEIQADAILLAKNVDGVYDADPVKVPTARKFDDISYDEVLSRHLAVMDTTATCLAMDNHIPVLVFGLAEEESIVRVLQGESLGTLVH